jgi:hypothetical protein
LIFWNQGGALADLHGDLFAFFHELTHGDHVVHQSQPQRFLGADPVPGIEHLQGAAQGNQARQALGATAARQPAETGLAQTELGVFRGHTDVARQGLFQSAAVGVTVDGRNDGLVEFQHQRGEAVYRLFIGPLDIIGLHVAARGKRPLPRTREDGHTEGGVVAEFLPDVREQAIGLVIAGIQPLGTVDGDIGDGSLFLEQHLRHR